MPRSEISKSLHNEIERLVSAAIDENISPRDLVSYLQDYWTAEHSQRSVIAHRQFQELLTVVRS